MLPNMTIGNEDTINSQQIGENRSEMISLDVVCCRKRSMLVLVKQLSAARGYPRKFVFCTYSRYSGRDRKMKDPAPRTVRRKHPWILLSLCVALWEEEKQEERRVREGGPPYPKHKQYEVLTSNIFSS